MVTSRIKRFPIVASLLVFTDRFSAQGPKPERLIVHPEALSGFWETPDGQGGAVGMLITINTKVPGRPKSLVNQPQYQVSWQAGLYHRTSPQLSVGQFNYFSDSDHGALNWDGKRLIIQFGASPYNPIYSINLVFDEQRGTWTGRYQRGDFNQQVVLRRPQPTNKDKESLLVGPERPDAAG